MVSKKHVAPVAYTFLELQNMYSARLVCHADSSSTFQTKLCDMILHDTIDIQKHEDTKRCSSYIELVTTTSMSFANILDLPMQYLRPFYVTW